ncbi:MAG: aminodeoxychorismate/anthranilate synthase component II [Deltaproteobacteria bacterium]|nr:aminodeoxychorismate/anthranilate synthase component II [Deltaproteobacteria bacterium]
MRLLFLENEDSFSWNVVDLLPFSRRQITIVPGREVGRRPELLAGADAVVIGPGPMDPLRVGLVDVVRAAAELRLPLLGICLGHQAIGLAFGSRLVRVQPMHGKLSTVTFRCSRLFSGLCGAYRAMRYHSLALAEVGRPLAVVAATDDGVPMAIEHAALPMAGLQFHPDSYATEQGFRMVASFFEAVAR